MCKVEQEWQEACVDEQGASKKEMQRKWLRAGGKDLGGVQNRSEHTQLGSGDPKLAWT